MSKALIIAGKDMKEALRSRTTFFYFLIFVVLALPYVDGLKNRWGATPLSVRPRPSAPYFEAKITKR